MRYSDILDGLQQQEEALLRRHVLAPARAGGRLRVEANGLVWECRVADPFDGWGVFQIGPDRLARLVREATFIERESWARRHPRRRMALLEPGRAASRAWCDDLERETTVLLADGIDVFETLVAAWDGAHHWALGIDPAVHPSRAARLRERFSAAAVPLASETPLIDPRRAPARDARTTQRLAAALAFAGAELIDWQPDGRGYLVTWRKRDRVVTSWMNERLGIESAGLCLSGLDAEHDLVSLASLIDQQR